MNEELHFVKERLVANNGSTIQTIKDVCDKYGYNLADAKKVVDMVANEENNSCIPKRIVKTIIVANNSQKK